MVICSYTHLFALSVFFTWEKKEVCNLQLMGKSHISWYRTRLEDELNIVKWENWHDAIDTSFYAYILC